MCAIYHGPFDLSEVLGREHLIADIFRTHNPKGHTGGESNRKWNRTTIVVVCNKATKKTAGAAGGHPSISERFSEVSESEVIVLQDH